MKNIPIETEEIILKHIISRNQPFKNILVN